MTPAIGDPPTAPATDTNPATAAAASGCEVGGDALGVGLGAGVRHRQQRHVKTVRGSQMLLAFLERGGRREAVAHHAGHDQDAIAIGNGCQVRRGRRRRCAAAHQ
jgi:hypothetical protein